MQSDDRLGSDLLYVLPGPKRRGESATRLIISLSFPIATLSDEICLHVASPPTVATLSGLSHSTRRALAQKLGPIFIQGEKPAYTRSHLRPSIQEKLEIVTSSTRRMYAWCTGQRDEKGFLEGVSSSGTILPWIHCQGKGKTPCVESEEELSACARVRLSLSLTRAELYAKG